MASADGGMEIEEVAAKTPERILKETITPGLGLTPFQARKLAFGIGITGAQANLAAQAMMALARANDALDASLAEINPFILTKDGKVYALDAKINLDDNALFRHKDLIDLRDLNEEDPLEVEASRFGLNYIKLDGTVACMVNGAGLAMATMDIIKYAGGSPANFLDVGGGANAEQISNAFRILLSDKAVKAVLINIFGGILRCDTLATGVVAAARELSIKVPIVVRMEGTNVELGRKILDGFGIEFHGRRGHARRGGKSGEAGTQSVRVKEQPCERTGQRKHDACWCRDSPARKARSTRSRPSPTGPKWWAASRRAKAGKNIWTCRCSTRWPRA